VIRLLQPSRWAELALDPLPPKRKSCPVTKLLTGVRAGNDARPRDAFLWRTGPPTEAEIEAERELERIIAQR
jgi:hypothetical protein